jgi:hypothetical protein
MRIRWDDFAKQDILRAVETLKAQGMPKPPKRAVIYVLRDWSQRIGHGIEMTNMYEKSDYGSLCRYIAMWRREGDTRFPFGMFSDESGADAIPLSEQGIQRAIDRVSKSPFAFVAPDGTLWAIFVEHAALVGPLSGWLEGRVAVLSSSGMIREEAFYSMLQNLETLRAELGAKRIAILGLVDYDKGGVEIFDAHKDFAAHYFPGIEIKKWGLDREQIVGLGLNPNESWQIDGVVGLDGDRMRRELRAIVGLGSAT